MSEPTIHHEVDSRLEALLNLTRFAAERQQVLIESVREAIDAHDTEHGEACDCAVGAALDKSMDIIEENEVSEQ
jgi:hypothetical protein